MMPDIKITAFKDGEDLEFEVSLEKADRIEGIESLKSSLGEVSPAQKRLLLDLETLKIPLDNIEGLTFGPELADGSRGLILVSDNNFSPLQETQILGFQIKVQKTSWQKVKL